MQVAVPIKVELASGLFTEIDYQQQITMNPTLQISRCTKAGCEKFSIVFY
jgi:invasion protein IalB